jgi:hypothetical protein
LAQFFQSAAALLWIALPDARQDVGDHADGEQRLGDCVVEVAGQPAALGCDGGLLGLCAQLALDPLSLGDVAQSTMNKRSSARSSLTMAASAGNSSPFFRRA